MSFKIFVGNDMRVYARGLKDASGLLMTGATVQATLYESDGVTEVSGQTWPLSMVEVSDGNYEATLAKEANVTADTQYEVKVTAVASDIDGEWKEPVIATKRRFGQ